MALPLLFLKPPSALLAPGAPIVRPAGYARVDHEGELCVVIGRRARHLSCAQGAASSGPVFDEDGFAQLLRQFIGDHPRHKIHETDGPEGRHQADITRGPFLRAQGAAGRDHPHRA